MIDPTLTDGDGDATDDARLDAELAETEAMFGTELRTLLEPTIGLSERTRHEVNEALVARSALALGVDLLSVGWHTARTLFGATAPTPPPLGAPAPTPPTPSEEATS